MRMSEFGLLEICGPQSIYDRLSPTDRPTAEYLRSRQIDGKVLGSLQAHFDLFELIYGLPQDKIRTVYSVVYPLAHGLKAPSKQPDPAQTRQTNTPKPSKNTIPNQANNMSEKKDTPTEVIKHGEKTTENIRTIGGVNQTTGNVNIDANGIPTTQGIRMSELQNYKGELYCRLNQRRMLVSSSHEPEIIVCRTTRGNFSIDSTKISSRHAILKWDNTKKGFFLQDLGSTNGTFLQSDYYELKEGTIVAFTGNSYQFVNLNFTDKHLYIKDLDGQISLPLGCQNGEIIFGKGSRCNFTIQDSSFMEHAVLSFANGKFILRKKEAKFWIRLGLPTFPSEEVRLEILGTNPIPIKFGDIDCEFKISPLP
eukprot:TRINITY_DN5303_c0_g1_i1.p1 TRINITY_DN5303_c0_g1~~TRINITY_DN5303_c0_g1_i1.p1  ORF type:complete len:366 (+),score=28.77 TRINITY_DN5303_c0_g1_i1:57-1154(+)